MKSVTLIIMSFISIFSSLYGREKIVFGKISNIDNTPAEYVLVSFFDKDNVIQSTQTDSLGKYKINVEFPLTGCNLVVSNWGNKLYETNISYSDEVQIEKNIQLSEINTVGLKEVTVKGERKGFTLKSDRYVYSPDIALLTSGTAFDVLKQIPGIKADEDQISLLFKSGTNIYLNNKPLRLPVSSLVEYLKSMPSDNIKNIEVITNPGSQYEASTTGGIINIVLHKNIDDGFNGQVTLNDVQARKNRQAASANFRYRRNKLGLEGGISAFNYAAKYSDRTDIITKDGNIQESKSINTPKSTNISFNLSAEYAINDNHIFNLFSTLKFNKPKTKVVSYTEYSNMESYSRIDSVTYTENEDKNSKINNYFFNGSYQWLIDKKGQTLNVSVDYMDYLNEQNRYTQNQLVEDNDIFIDRSKYMTSVPQKIKNYSSKIDYTLPFEKNKLGLGVLYSHNKTDDEYRWNDWSGTEYIPNADRSNIFAYTENIGAVYGTWSRQWSDKLSTDIGLRLEYTSTKSDIRGSQTNKHNDDYFQLFPSFFISYKPNDTWTLNYSLTGKVQRPAFWELNPVRFYINENLYTENNPYLKNIRSFTQGLSFVIRNKYSLNAEYSFLKDDSGQFLIPSPDQENVNYYGRFNYGNNQSLYIYTAIPFNFFDGFWKSNTSIGMQFKWFKINNSDISRYYKNESSVGAVIRVSNTFRILEKQNFWGYLNFRYYSPEVYLNRKGISFPVFNIELKKIWTDWTLSLIGNDLTNGTRIIAKETSKQTLSPYLTNNFTSNTDNRSIQLRISYRFGNSKAKTNHSAKIANEEVRSRVN